MTCTILLLLARDRSLDAVMASYAAAAKAMPSFEVQSSFVTPRGPVKATFVLDKNKRLIYDAVSYNGEHYILTVSSSNYREVNRTTKVYEEYPYPGQAIIYSSRISELPGTAPIWLRASTIRQMMPSETVISLAGTKVVAGSVCDDVHGEFKDRMGTATFDILVAPAGHIVSFKKIAVSPVGRSQMSWELSGYKSAANISASRFENRIPDGYMPYVLPDHYKLVPIGTKLNLNGWIEASTGRSWSRQAGSPLLFVLAGMDSLPSKRALAEVAKWKPALSQAGVQVAFASDEPLKADAKGLLYDPTQTSVRALDVPATPIYFLVDRGGVLRNLWLGFSPASAGKLKSDVLSAVKALK